MMFENDAIKRNFGDDRPFVKLRLLAVLDHVDEDKPLVCHFAVDMNIDVQLCQLQRSVEA